MEKNPTKSVFTGIYEKNLWGGDVRSGPGSTLAATIILRQQLVSAFSKLGVSSLVDAPCGDITWVTQLSDQLDFYFGVDIVQEVILRNKALIDRPNHHFITGNVCEEILPAADAILCRDCLVHLPFEMALKAVEKFRLSGSTYLMTTTFPSVTVNREINVGGWRPLNLQAAPFSFPEPEMLLLERPVDPKDRVDDKSIGVWRLKDLPC